MKKKTTAIMLGAIMLFTQPVHAEENKTATLTTEPVYVNGQLSNMQGYNIDGYNYYKLRDLGYALDFNVTYDSVSNTILLYNSKKYEGDVANKQKATTKATAKPTDQYVYVDDMANNMNGYNIDGYNYFKLRDVGDKMGFDVNYNADQKAIYIGDDARPSPPPMPTPKPPEVIPQPYPTLPADAKQPTRIPPLTSPPVVGSTLGDIMIDTSLNPKTSDSYNYAYKGSSLGQCTWYCFGRFNEVYGYPLPIDMGNARKWINNAENHRDTLDVIYDINDIRPQSVAVYAPTDPNSTDVGHVVFVEYVERDSNGNPTYIYFTDSNGNNTTIIGKFEPNIDGTVQKWDFEKFKNRNKRTLLGYIIPKI